MIVASLPMGHARDARRRLSMSRKCTGFSGRTFAELKDSGQTRPGLQARQPDAKGLQHQHHVQRQDHH